MAGTPTPEQYYLAESAEWRPDRYYRYEHLTELIHNWAAEHPNLCSVESIGKTHQGRDIWAVTLTNKQTGPDTEKPAYYVDANIHAGEVTGSAVALGTIHRLLTTYGTDDRATRLLDETTLYVIPRIMVDASEHYLTHAERMRSSLTPWPEPETKDGLQIEDINGDGFVSNMRIKDPDGPWKVSSKDPRIMVRRAPDETGGEYYFVFPEGTIKNWDGGEVKIAPSLWGLDLNRNFPHEWEPEWVQSGGGPYPLSEPETRAIADFILAHPNICGSQHYHTFSAVILRASSLKPDDAFPKLDIRAYKAIGQMGEEETGYPCISIYHDFAYDKKKPTYGTFADWMWEHLGIYAFATELWSLPRKAGCEVKDFIKYMEERPEEDDVAMLKLLDEQLGGRGFTPWTPFDHPQLGPVEIGGYEFKFAIQNPPGPFLEEEINRNVPFTLRAMGASPKIHFVDHGVEALGEGVYKVWATVGNSGFLPTYLSETGKKTGRIKPVIVELTLPEGAEVVTGLPKTELGHLEGRVGQYQAIGDLANHGNLTRKRAEWIVKAPQGGELTVTAKSEKGGTVRQTVTLH